MLWLVLRGTSRGLQECVQGGLGGGLGGGLQRGLQTGLGRGLAVKLRSGLVQVRSGSGPGLVQYRLKFTSFELDTEVGRLVPDDIQGNNQDDILDGILDDTEDDI